MVGSSAIWSFESGVWGLPAGVCRQGSAVSCLPSFVCRLSSPESPIHLFIIKVTRLPPNISFIFFLLFTVHYYCLLPSPAFYLLSLHCSLFTIYCLLLSPSARSQPEQQRGAGDGQQRPGDGRQAGPLAEQQEVDGDHEHGRQLHDGGGDPERRVLHRHQ